MMNVGISSFNFPRPVIDHLIEMNTYTSISITKDLDSLDTGIKTVQNYSAK